MHRAQSTYCYEINAISRLTYINLRMRRIAISTNIIAAAFHKGKLTVKAIRATTI